MKLQQNDYEAQAANDPGVIAKSPCVSFQLDPRSSVAVEHFHGPGILVNLCDQVALDVLGGLMIDSRCVRWKIQKLAGLPNQLHVVVCRTCGPPPHERTVHDRIGDAAAKPTTPRAVPSSPARRDCRASSSRHVDFHAVAPAGNDGSTTAPWLLIES